MTFFGVFRAYLAAEKMWFLRGAFYIYGHYLFAFLLEETDQIEEAGYPVFLVYKSVVFLSLFDFVFRTSIWREERENAMHRFLTQKASCSK